MVRGARAAAGQLTEVLSRASSFAWDSTRPRTEEKPRLVVAAEKWRLSSSSAPGVNHGRANSEL